MFAVEARLNVIYSQIKIKSSQGDIELKFENTIDQTIKESLRANGFDVNDVHDYNRNKTITVISWGIR